MSVASDTLVVAADAVLSSPLGGEVVLLEPVEGIYFSLNEVGAVVWDRLRDPATVLELCDLVEAEFEVDRATCEADVGRLVDELIRHRLVEVVGPVGP